MIVTNRAKKVVMTFYNLYWRTFLLMPGKKCQIPFLIRRENSIKHDNHNVRAKTTTAQQIDFKRQNMTFIKKYISGHFKEIQKKKISCQSWDNTCSRCGVNYFRPGRLYFFVTSVIVVVIYLGGEVVIYSSKKQKTGSC